jgi:predicted AAA+ superfamily ATPase
MKRKITENLISWKNKESGRMPLLVYGARQVGKTHILREFGEHFYKNVAYINLETNRTVSSYFSENIEPERIIRFLETEARERIIPGGMPRAVLEFVQTKSLLPVPDVQNKIINGYIADMAKYASNTESVKIRSAYNSIPVQLAKKNKKFQYKPAQKGGAATIFGAAIDWLHFAGVVLKCERIDRGLMPISVYRDLSAFKLYMSDVGLLTMKSGISQQTILAAGEIANSFLGAISENYAAQAMATNHYGLYYWTNGGIAELDFVLQKGDDIIAVEVKTGTRTKSRSLNMFVEKYKPAYSIRISSKNFGFENGIHSVPLYAVFCI